VTPTEILTQTMRDCEILARDSETSSIMERRLIDMVWAYRQQLKSQYLNTKEICEAIEDLYSEAKNSMRLGNTLESRHPAVVESLEKAYRFVLEENDEFNYRDPSGRISKYLNI